MKLATNYMRLHIRQKKHLLLLLWCSLAVPGAHAQSIGNDSRNKDIFNFYKTKSISIPATTADGSLKINSNFLVGKSVQHFISPIDNDVLVLDPAKKTYSLIDSAKLTYQSSYAINWSLEVSNIKNDVTHIATFHPGYALSIGFGQNVDQFNNWDNIYNLGYWSPHPWNVSIYGKLDNVSIYDTLAKVQVRNKPFSYGVIGQITIMPYNYLFISTSLNFERGNNLADLKNFQNNTPTYTDPNVIALDEFAGKLGNLKTRNLFRFRISMPYITPVIPFINGVQPCIIPYYSFYGEFSGKTNHMFGVFANILGDVVYRRKNSTIVSGAGIGVDWTHNSVWTHSIFVSGTLDLWKVFPHNTSKSSKKHRETNSLF